MNPFDPEDAAKLLAAHQAYHDRQDAEIDLWSHQVVRVMYEMNEEQCLVLAKLFKSFEHTEGPEEAARWGGVLMARMHVEFGICHACGEKHDEAVSRLAESNPS